MKYPLLHVFVVLSLFNTIYKYIIITILITGLPCIIENCVFTLNYKLHSSMQTVKLMCTSTITGDNLVHPQKDKLYSINVTLSNNYVILEDFPNIAYNLKHFKVIDYTFVHLILYSLTLNNRYL